MSQVAILVAEVERARLDYLARVTDLSNEQGDFKPAPHDWSIAQITEHLVHAELAGIMLIWSAADAVRRGKPVWTGQSPNAGLTIEQVIERTWRARETAPESALPTWGGPLAYWAEGLRACAPLLASLGRALEGLELERVIHPHVISGPLDARQRLEFLRFHLDRHRGQVERVRRALRD